MSSRPPTSSMSGQQKQKTVADLIAELEKKKGSPISTMQPRKLVSWTQVLQNRSMFTTDDATGQEAERQRRLAFSSQQPTTCKEENLKTPLIYLTTPYGISMPIDEAPEWKPICKSSDKMQELKNWALSLDLSPEFMSKTEASQARVNAYARAQWLRRDLEEQKSRLMFAQHKASVTRENGRIGPANDFKLDFWASEALRREARIIKTEKKLEKAILGVRRLNVLKHHRERQITTHPATNSNETEQPHEPKPSKWGGIRRQVRVKQSIQLGSAPVQSNPLMEAMENDSFGGLLGR